MSKYTPLKTFLQNSRQQTEVLTFQQLESILGFSLPPSAYKYREWWANENINNTTHTQARAWLEAGWIVTSVDLGTKVTFSKTKRGRRMNMYTPLKTFLQNSRQLMEVLTFQQLESILGFSLPPSAYRYRAWWANENIHNARHTQARAWLEAGWIVTSVDLGTKVTFSKTN